MPANKPPVHNTIIVTGMSGAGKSTALKTLEDLGYEAVDNIPLTILPMLFGDARDSSQPLVIGIDVRSRDFDTHFFTHDVLPVVREADETCRVLFLDANDEVLQRRFSETRRKHPIAEDRRVLDGINQEREIIRYIRDEADMILDTSDFSIPDLKRWIKKHFSVDESLGFSVHLTSFSYRHGLPRDADLVFDVRFLKNPHYQEDLKMLTGREKPVGNYIKRDPAFKLFFTQLQDMLMGLLPRYIEEGKSYLTIAVGCTGGKHRSVFCSEMLAVFLKEQHYNVSLYHRELKD